MSWFWWLLAVLCCWGLIVLVRRAGEGGGHGGTDAQGHGEAPGGPGAQTPRRADAQTPSDDEIDYDELERAEREVKDLDANVKPEEGFEGDDWGPGTPKAR